MLVGTDIIEIERIAQVAERQARFPKKVLSVAEFNHYQTLKPHRQQSFLAGRFSAKEAYGKALGTGVGTRLKFDDIDIMPNANGVPQVLGGPVTYPQAQVSISHSRELATATVIIDLTEEEVQSALQRFYD